MGKKNLPDTHQLQPDPPEGSRATIERELERQQNYRESGARKFKESRPESEDKGSAGTTKPDRKS